jgi:hypothetical protein
MKMTVFWDIAPCSPVVEISRRISAYCLHHQGLMMMEAVSSSEMSVSFDQATRRNIPENSHLQFLN